jgi:serine/threonine protein kinase
VGGKEEVPRHPALVRVARREWATPNSFQEWRELCSGGEIMDVIAEHGPALVWGDSGKALQWFTTATAGVAHCHAHGIASGRLRLEHVLLQDESPKLLNFLTPAMRAIVHGPPILDADDRDRVLLALRPDHSCLDAPEIAGRSHAEFHELAAADVWALGVLLTSLLAGAPPNIVRASDRVSVQLPQLLEQRAGEKLNCLIRGMLRLNPADRPSATSVHDAASAIVMPPPPSAPPSALMSAPPQAPPRAADRSCRSDSDLSATSWATSSTQSMDDGKSSHGSERSYGSDSPRRSSSRSSSDNPNRDSSGSPEPEQHAEQSREAKMKDREEQAIRALGLGKRARCEI